MARRVSVLWLVDARVSYRAYVVAGDEFMAQEFVRRELPPYADIGPVQLSTSAAPVEATDPILEGCAERVPLGHHRRSGATVRWWQKRNEK